MNKSYESNQPTQYDKYKFLDESLSHIDRFVDEPDFQHFLQMMLRAYESIHFQYFFSKLILKEKQSDTWKFAANLNDCIVDRFFFECGDNMLKAIQIINPAIKYIRFVSFTK